MAGGGHPHRIGPPAGIDGELDEAARTVLVFVGDPRGGGVAFGDLQAAVHLVDGVLRGARAEPRERLLLAALAGTVVDDDDARTEGAEERRVARVVAAVAVGLVDVHRSYPVLRADELGLGVPREVSAV